jgi:hypothetical protein
VDVRRYIGLTAALGLVLAACASGPSQAAIDRDQQPSTTTTTEPPPEGVVVVSIENGRFSPSNLEFNLTDFWIVEWQHNDAPIALADGTVQLREYQIISRDRNEDRTFLFESPLLEFGDTYQMDFSELPEDIYRYNTFLGQQRIPGLVDTRASR